MANKYGRFYVDVMSMHKEVTGSCILCVVKIPNQDQRIKFIVDCGLFQEEEYSDYNKRLLFNAEELNFACITHAHVDHIGRLPLLLANNFYKKIYCSQETARLVPYSLRDCWKVSKETAKRNDEKPLYSEGDVEETLRSLEGCQFGRTTQVNDFIKVIFFENGHLYGASVILVQIEVFDHEPINLLFTGDYGTSNMFFDVPQLPQWVRKLPLNVVIESTYGSMTTADKKPCFEQNVVDAIAQNKSVVVPSFSLGRGQEILLILKRLQDAGRLDPKVAIYYCGNLGIRYSKEIFLNNPGFFEESRNFLPENMTFVDKSNRPEMFADSRVKIVVGSSGMGTYGPMQTIIPFYMKENALIHFTGYCAEGTMGRRLYDAEMGKKVELSGMTVKKNANVQFTNEFSAHAKSDELIDLLKQFSNLNAVLVNHGSLASKKAFSELVLDEVDCNNVAILSREIGFRFTSFGLETPLNTKFF